MRRFAGTTRVPPSRTRCCCFTSRVRSAYAIKEGSFEMDDDPREYRCTVCERLLRRGDICSRCAAAARTAVGVAGSWGGGDVSDQECCSQWTQAVRWWEVNNPFIFDSAAWISYSIRMFYRAAILFIREARLWAHRAVVVTARSGDQAWCVEQFERCIGFARRHRDDARNVRRMYQ